MTISVASKRLISRSFLHNISIASDLSKYEYKIFLNKQENNIIDKDNFAEDGDLVFIRPLKLSIFDGTILNNDKNTGVSPIRTGFDELAGSSHNLFIADEFNKIYDPIVFSNPSDNSSVSLDLVYPPVLVSPSHNCTYFNNGVCFRCVIGFVFNSISKKCQICPYDFYNILTNECDLIRVGSPSDYIETYSNNADKNVYSPNVVSECFVNSFVNFYNTFIIQCDSPQYTSNTINVVTVVIELNSLLLTGNLPLPFSFTLTGLNPSFNKFAFKRGFLIQSEISDRIQLTYATKLTNMYHINHLFHMEKILKTILPGSMIDSMYSFKTTKILSTYALNLSSKTKYSLNDYIPETNFIHISNIYNITVYDEIPMNMRRVDDSQYIVPCGQGCLKCNDLACVLCDTGYYIRPNSTNCGACSPSCVACFLNPTFCVQPINYFEASVKSLFFFEYQRSGYIDNSQRKVCWRYHSFLMDQGDNLENLVGGWFDGIGTMKLNLQLSYALLTLAQGLIYFDEDYDAIGAKSHLLEVLKPAFDYLQRCYVDNQNIYSHCGDIQDDNLFWGRPEDFSGSRKCHKIPQGAVAIDLVASMSSAFSAGAIIYKTTDSGFSDLLLSKADKLHSYARSSNSDDQLSTHFPELFVEYQSSADPKDELLEASLMLDKAKSEKVNYGLYGGDVDFISTDMTNQANWNKRLANLSLLMFEFSRDTIYLAFIEIEIFSWISYTNFPDISNYKPFTDIFELIITLFYSLIFLKFSPNANNLYIETWVKQQVDFLLGHNTKGLSHMVGYGNNSIKNLRHKASSCESPPSPCSGSDETKTDANPNMVIGALVRGLGTDGYAVDSRQAEQNGVRIINNAPWTGILVRMHSLFGKASDVDPNLFTFSTCVTDSNFYIGENASNYELYEDYLNKKNSSPFVKGK